MNPPLGKSDHCVLMFDCEAEHVSGGKAALRSNLIMRFIVTMC